MMGLSTSHISPRPPHGVSKPPEFHVDLYENGQSIELSIDKQENSVKQHAIAKRGKIETFSFSSRRRLLRKVARLDRNCLKPPLFITLTYPKFFPTDPKIYKSHLDNFCKRFARRFPDGFLFWKLEFQRRGAPHYHLMVFGIDRVDFSWVSEVWYEVVGSGDEKHLKAGTQVEKSKGWKAVLAYCAKYMGKTQDYSGLGDGEGVQVETVEVGDQEWVSFSVDVNYVGRFWGLRNADGYSKSVKQVRYTVSFGGFVQVKRVMRKYLESEIKRRRGKKRRLFRKAREGASAFMNYEIARRLISEFIGSEVLSCEVSP